VSILGFLTPLALFLGNGQIINPTVAGVIFGNLPDILQLHEAIFKDLQKTVDEIALGKQVNVSYLNIY